MRAAVLTVSTSIASGVGEDTSGRLLAELAHAAGAEIAVHAIVSDDADAIERWLREQVAADIPLIFTTGGTGFTPDDITPEATRRVIERDAPGFAEAMRAESITRTPEGDDLARCLGHRRTLADRQLPRQPERDPGAVPGDRAGARARGGDAAPGARAES